MTKSGYKVRSRRETTDTNVLPIFLVSKKVLICSDSPLSTNCLEMVRHASEFFSNDFRKSVLPRNPREPYFMIFAGREAQYAMSAPRWGTPRKTIPRILSSRAPYKLDLSHARIMDCGFLHVSQLKYDEHNL